MKLTYKKNFKNIVNKENDLRTLGEFFNADEVIYENKDKSESFKIIKGGRILILNIMENKIDGAYLSLEEKDKPTIFKSNKMKFIQHRIETWKKTEV